MEVQVLSCAPDQFSRAVRRCGEQGIPAYLLMVPNLGALRGSRRDARRVMEIGRDAGFTVVDLHGAYRGGQRETAPSLAPWDDHPKCPGTAYDCRRDVFSHAPVGSGPWIVARRRAVTAMAGIPQGERGGLFDTSKTRPIRWR